MTTQPSPAPQGPARRSPQPARVWRRWLAAAVAVPLLAGCGSTSFGAQTNQPYQPGPGITDRSSEVDVLNAFVVTDGEGNGTLVAGLLNQQTGTDVLQSATLTPPTGKPPSASILSGTVNLPEKKMVLTSESGDIRFGGNLQAGTNYSLTLTFADAAPVTLTIPVITDIDEFASVPLGPTPTPTPTTPSHTPVP